MVLAGSFIYLNGISNDRGANSTNGLLIVILQQMKGNCPALHDYYFLTTSD
jgi:hypothetical protein